MFVQVGDRIGDYVVTKLINRGGMSLVCRARHVHIARRKVALKIILPEHARQAELVRRFVRETQVIARLNHPNIPRIYNFIKQTDRDPPLYCMVMELLSGHDLALHIKEHGPLPPDLAVEIARQTAEALVALHGAAVLHRDIKPANIFLAAQPDGRPLVKLLDFGLAKGTNRRHGARLTREGQVAGTPEYMSPEQLLDKPVDARADVYALGASLYQMLVGVPPFGVAADADYYGDFLLRIAKDPPPAVSTRRRRDLPPVPPALEALVAKCLQKDPNQRFASAAALRDVLAQASAGELDPQTFFYAEEETTGVSAPPPQGTKQRRWLLASLTALLLAATALLLVFHLR
jgi:serine/threonine-protein kinase